MNIGVPELLIVLGVVLLIFGPKRLPMLGRQLGSGMREFKDSITRKDREEIEEGDDETPEEPSAGATARRAADGEDVEVLEGEVFGDRRT